MFGIDWAACSFGIIGIYLLAIKNRYGFIFLVIGSLFWLVMGILVKSYGLIVASAIHAGVETVGFYKWKR